MGEIDELEGETLAEAIALALGKYRCIVGNTHEWWSAETNECFTVSYYRPDLNIALAWELDGDEWYWKSEEFPHGLYVSVETGPDPCSWESTWVKWDDFSTKIHAYATARCRTFLKATASNF